jgi:hypothetical protein
MKRFTVIGASASFMSGVLELSKEQYEARTHALKPLRKKGRYEVLAQVHFKRGEELGYDGEVSKALLQLIEPARPVEPEEDKAGGQPPSPGEKLSEPELP